MDSSLFPALAPVSKRVVPFLAAVVVAGAGVGYAVHEHNSAQTLATQAQTLSAQNQQMNEQLNATHSQLDALAAKVNQIALNNQARPAETATGNAAASAAPRVVRLRSAAQDARFKKLQSQIDAQSQALDSTRSDLDNTRTELTGSIARTHDDIVVLQKKGERNYYEFDIQKSKDFKHEGPVSVRLKKANTKSQYADLLLIVDDRNLTQKHVNLYQPVMFYAPDSPLPMEVVINDITKDHIHGYVSAPKYRQSELNVASNADANAGADQTSNSTAPPASQRQKLPVPANNPSQP